MEMGDDGMKMWTVLEPYLLLSCGLGEAPFYEETTNKLRFVDIVKRELHVVDLERGPSSLVSFRLEDAVSVTADIEGSDDDKIIVGAKYGFATLARRTGKLEYVQKIWDERDGPGKEERMRFNDGAVDSRGRFFAGAMNDPLVTKVTDEGVVFRLDPDMKLHRVIENVSIPNGMGWSLDEKNMYFTDSPTKTIFKFDYDVATGDISNRQSYFQLQGEADDAVPDGLAVDVEGCIWTAISSGGKVLRISPQGKVIGKVFLPTRCVSCPRFVGEDLFATSAAEEDPKNYPESARLGGSLFRVHVGLMGMPMHKFRRQA